ncbi:hypothetical protein SDC9_183505 [bioreactor metagenome]|uniref:Uncharacterized protein n=1 Tax=bioreactor metagenome TaxID=1076179 RepID=A0A645HBA9_9ZZZZ
MGLHFFLQAIGQAATGSESLLRGDEEGDGLHLVTAAINVGFGNGQGSRKT